MTNANTIKMNIQLFCDHCGRELKADMRRGYPNNTIVFAVERCGCEVVDNG